MVLTRHLFSLLFATLFTSFLSLQFSSILGLAQPNLEECLALLDLAGKLNLSTNCNCTFLPSHDGLWMPCNGSCTMQMPPSHNFVGCAAAGHPVHELHLSKLGLQGNLSWIESFKHLKLLDASFNNLSGSIPTSLWMLGELTYVNLSSNSLNWNISSLNASKLSHIQTLDFSHNQIMGHFPGNLCTSLPNLTRLNIHNNHIIGYANLSLCQRLQSFDASFNRLQGPIFDDFNAKKLLKSINLKKNFLLNGSIPDLSGFSQLVGFDVSFNNFSGMFGSHHNELPSNLSRINVSHNNLQVGLSTSTISSFGCSSFWPNKACKGCFPVVCRAPSTPVSLSKPAHRQPTMKKRTKVRLNIIISITAGSLGAIMIIIGVAFCIFNHNRKEERIWPPHRKRPPPLPLKNIQELGPYFFESPSGSWIADVKDPSNVPVVIFQKPLLNLTFADLIHATKSFHREFEVGDGTDLVYACGLPGVLADNAKVAIKVVEDGHSLSNEVACAAFSALGKIKHDNLVPLLGYCIVGEEKLLIYKHMEGGSLEDVLHSVPEGMPLLESTDASTAEDWSNMESWPEEDKYSCLMDSSSKPCIGWKTRHNIALGVARALAYLHNGCHLPIVHGAVSSSCILVDVGANEARLANYGGSWGLPRRQAPGYVAPECHQTTQTAAFHLSSALKCRESVQVVAMYSSKCDVYAMGVILLELATGRRAVGRNYGSASATTLVAWVRGLMKGKRGETAVDPQLSASPNLPQILETMKVGYLCTADSPSKRPTMQQVVGLLKDLGQ